MTNEKLKQIFKENADCYFTMEMQSAMTETKFIEVVSELMQPTDNINIKAMAEKEYPITMRMYANDKPPMDINEDARKVYIKGYKQAISTTPTKNKLT